MIIESLDDIMMWLTHLYARYFILTHLLLRMILSEEWLSTKMTQLILRGRKPPRWEPVSPAHHPPWSVAGCTLSRVHRQHVSSYRFAMKGPWTFFLGQGWPFAAIIIKIQFLTIFIIQPKAFHFWSFKVMTEC